MNSPKGYTGATEKHYYTVLPSFIRYCKELSPSEKILYSEIVALSYNSKGYCWASNGYFANMYGVSKVMVSHWISSLVKQGLISENFVNNDKSPGLKERILKPTDIETMTNINSYIDQLEEKDSVRIDNPEFYEYDNVEDIPENYSFGEKDKYIKNKEISNQVDEIINYMNSTCHTHFKKSNKDTQRLIKSKLKEGFSVQDFKKVIEYKYNQWGINPFKFSDGQFSDVYLRPQTLFGNKFESYLNETQKLHTNLNNSKLGVDQINSGYSSNERELFHNQVMSNGVNIKERMKERVNSYNT